MDAFLLNWYLGWFMVMVGLLFGAGLGLFFEREDFLGGYTSFRRRMFRLGHIACVVLGMFNLIGATLFLPKINGTAGEIAATAFLIGGVTMPVMCVLSGWRMNFRFGLALPVAALIVGVTAVLLGGVPCA